MNVVSMDTGSRVYGTYTQDSDFDRLNVVWPTRDQLFGMEQSSGSHKIYGTVDTTTQEIRRYAALLNKRSVNAVETLFTPWQHIYEQDSDTYAQIREDRRFFIDRHFLDSCVGFIRGMVSGPAKSKMHGARVALYARRVITEHDLWLDVDLMERQVLMMYRNGEAVPNLWSEIDFIEKYRDRVVSYDTEDLLNTWLYRALSRKWMR